MNSDKGLAPFHWNATGGTGIGTKSSNVPRRFATAVGKARVRRATTDRPLFFPPFANTGGAIFEAPARASKTSQVWAETFHHIAVQSALKAAVDRINELKDVAKEEGVSASVHSEGRLMEFIREQGIVVAPLISLRDDGCFRAVWRSNDETQVGITFRESGIEFVILSDRFNARGDKVYGTFDARTVAKVVRAVCPSIWGRYGR